MALQSHPVTGNKYIVISIFTVTYHIEVYHVYVGVFHRDGKHVRCHSEDQEYGIIMLFAEYCGIILLACSIILTRDTAKEEVCVLKCTNL